MKKSKFLEILKEDLWQLRYDEIQMIIKNYNDKIDSLVKTSNFSEEEAIKQLGNPKIIAQREVIERGIPHQSKNALKLISKILIMVTIGLIILASIRYIYPILFLGWLLVCLFILSPLASLFLIAINGLNIFMWLYIFVSISLFGLALIFISPLINTTRIVNRIFLKFTQLLTEVSKNLGESYE